MLLALYSSPFWAPFYAPFCVFILLLGACDFPSEDVLRCWMHLARKHSSQTAASFPPGWFLTHD